MTNKKRASTKASPIKSRSHCTTTLSLIAAVTAWACVMCYLQDDNTPQHQLSAPVVTTQEAIK